MQRRRREKATSSDSTQAHHLDLDSEFNIAVIYRADSEMELEFPGWVTNLLGLL